VPKLLRLNSGQQQEFDLAEFITVTFDGNGADIAISSEIRTVIPYNAQIVGWYIDSNADGDIVIDVRKLDEGWPTATESIVAGLPPRLSAQSENSNTTLTGWDTEIIAGNHMSFVVTSVSGIQRAILKLKVVKT
jgi:hypothetical protein